MKRNSVTIKVDKDARKAFKELAIALDCNMMEISRMINEEKEEIKKLLEKKK